MLLSPFIRQYAVVIIANLNVLSSGVGLSWTSPVLVKLANETTSPLGRPTTQEETSWILSLAGISGILGAFCVGFLSDTVGRKITILMSSVPKLVSWLLICFATDVSFLYAARVLQGLSDSVSLTVVSMYASEVASKEIRGSLGTVLQIMCTLGIVLTLCIGPFLSYLPLGIYAGVMSLACAAPAFLLPESPYFSYSKGKTEEALRTLTLLRGSAALAAEGMKELEQDHKKEPAKISDLLKSKPVLRGIFTALFLGIGAQLTGFNAVSFSLESVLVSTKTELSTSWSSVIVGLAQLLACLPTAFVTDKFGRKPILFTTLTLMCVGMTGLGTYFHLVDLGYPVSGFMKYLPLISILLTICGYSAGLGSLMFPLVAELFSDEARSLGVSIGMTGTTIALFITLRFFGPLISSFGPANVYWLCGVNSIIMAVFILLCVPETKGRSFAEIQAAM